MELNDIIEHLNTNEEASKGVMEAFKSKGFVIRSQDEETQFLGKVTKEYEETAIKPKVRELATQVEKDFMEASGIEKEEGERYYDYIKRGTKKLREELKALKEADKGTADYSAKIAEKEKEYKRILEEKDGIINQMKGEISTSQKRSLLNEVYNPIKAKIGQQPSYFSEYEKQVMNDIIKNSTIVEEDGQKLYVLTNEEGEPIKKNFQYVLVEKALEEKFKDAIDQGSKKVTGTETGKSKVVKSESTGLTRPAHVGTKVELRKWLESEGDKKPGTPDYYKAFAELGEGLPLK